MGDGLDEHVLGAYGVLRLLSGMVVILPLAGVEARHVGEAVVESVLLCRDAVCRCCRGSGLRSHLRPGRGMRGGRVDCGTKMVMRICRV